MIGIIGSGSWATAIVKILLEDTTRHLCWWVRRTEVRDSLASTGHNPTHLPRLQLDQSRLHVSTDLAEVVEASDVLVVAVPSAYVADVLGSLPPQAYAGKRFASVVKGFLPQRDTSVSAYLEQALGVPPEAHCLVSGPSHAEEVADGQPTFLTVASANRQLAEAVAATLRCGYIHPVVSDDTASLELCGMAKNVYAIAAGIAAGLGYGDNLLAVLIAAAASELHHLVGHPSNPLLLLSDLTVTCFSRHSRNRRLGEAVAHGLQPLDHLGSSAMVAEGYYSAATMHRLFPRGQAPLAEAVHSILYLGADPQATLNRMIDTFGQ